ncbi:hypothetical protein RhiirC2_781175 [Rhizophagus irregularis]|uniref:Uncharacterized protein n=1 Tax=Rhizophagus irregularis TaxID=588596 RepID=A0A2N1N627_9GLOM|nr:hypothetical protein RhiirC2_781175 [Rhizophagus irregularis]
MELKYLRGASNILVTRKGREYFFRMFDSKLSPRDIKDMYSWQAVKKVKIDNEKSDDIIIKEHVRTYEGHFSKIIRINKQKWIFRKRRTPKTPKFFGGTTNRTGSTVHNKNLVEDFNRLNSEFSVKGKEVETGSDTLNSNKKRVALTQGNGEDSDSDSDSDNRL